MVYLLILMYSQYIETKLKMKKLDKKLLIYIKTKIFESEIFLVF